MPVVPEKFTGWSLHRLGNQVLPGSHTRRQTCFSSYSECFEFFALIFLNSSQSQRIKFTYLPKPLKGPLKIHHPAGHISSVVNVLQHFAPLSHSHDCCSTNFDVHRKVSESLRPKEAYRLRYDAGSPPNTASWGRSFQ